MSITHTFFKGTIFLLFFLMSATALQAQSGATSHSNAPIYQVQIKEDIGPNAWRTLQKAYRNAQASRAELFIVELNTFGGLVNFADSMRTCLLESRIPTVVYINHNAASAGALIALASDKIYMHKGSSIGAASVVDQSGEIMPEKYQSYMRGLMRATAEAKGRDPRVAEAFVDPEIELPGLKSKGKILTLTGMEAVQLGLAVAEVSSFDALLKQEGYSITDVHYHTLTWIDHLIAFLINPAVSGILILLIVGGIYFELQTPGIGFALLVAVSAAILFFAPLYIQGLADHWEIALFVVGLVLIVLELFVIPGFGVTGILGLICLICGLAFSMVANDYFNFRLDAPNTLFNAFMLVLISMAGGIILLVIFGKGLMQTRAFRRLVLVDEQKSTEGYTAGVLPKTLVGRKGITKTVLRPSGKIDIDGNWYDAIARDGFIEAGVEVIVEKHENYNLVVRLSINH
jgi:membrane-bound serine protease (ClpP class)